jgi:hypothetical protein
MIEPLVVLASAVVLVLAVVAAAVVLFKRVQARRNIVRRLGR